MGVGRGYGKLLLFGEHAAVYGHPAVGIRLEEHLDVSVSPRESRDEPTSEDAQGVQPPGTAGVPGRWEAPGLVAGEREPVMRALAALADSPPAGRIDVAGTLPMSVGFGSSAAFCTALLRAVDDPAAGDPESLWAAAHRIEHVFHGTPSGIDTGLSIFPGASVIYPDPPGLPRRAPVGLPRAALLVGAIPRTSTTARLVAGIRAMRDRDHAAVERSLRTLGSLAAEAVNACPDAATFGGIADRAHAILRTLGLSTPQLEAVIAWLHEAGALGAKLSGAGGGGGFYGVFEDVGRAAAAAKQLEKETAQATIEIVYLRQYAIGD